MRMPKERELREVQGFVAEVNGAHSFARSGPYFCNVGKYIYLCPRFRDFLLRVIMQLN